MEKIKNETTKAAKKPILEIMIDLFYTKGLYVFFTKTVAAVAAVAIAILTGLHKENKESAEGKKAIQLVKCLWLVNHYKRKLAGIVSISSSVHDNCFCAAWRKIKDCICAKCYAYNQQAYQTGLKEHNILNGIILRNILIPVKAFKVLQIVFPYLRIESFGDIANVTQARNYLRIIKAFPRKRCAIWSKNIETWNKAINIEGKPENTTFVLSSPIVNKPYDITIIDKYPFIDHIFTVFTKAYAKKHNININCGGLKCITCIKAKKACYYRNTEIFINELKK